ncbi:MAG TPA: hypothetical protein VNQ79_05330 [Blastocatellia bacterium]|nr:hypothetical protein [Blastocatellia bacterium]
MTAEELREKSREMLMRLDEAKRKGQLDRGSIRHLHNLARAISLALHQRWQDEYFNLGPEGANADHR